jgi:uncharacterized membrane protein YgcG
VPPNPYPTDLVHAVRAANLEAVDEVVEGNVLNDRHMIWAWFLSAHGAFHCLCTSTKSLEAPPAERVGAAAVYLVRVIHDLYPTNWALRIQRVGSEGRGVGQRAGGVRRAGGRWGGGGGDL